MTCNSPQGFHSSSVTSYNVHVTPDTRTVGELLNIDPASVVDVGLYIVGSEPVSPRAKKAVVRAQRRSPRLLDAFLRDAQAGATDAEIARAAKCTRAQVRRWRLKRGLRRANGRPSAHDRATAAAVVLFGAPFRPVVSRVKADDAVPFEPPEYVVREPLDYSGFIRCVVALRNAGIAPGVIAKGLGVRDVDVERAERMGRRA